MTTLRAFTCDDLFRFNNINLDPLTETYGIPFYLQYLAHWPEYFIVAEAPGGELMGYIMGKAEGSVAREEWHGHVTALSVAPEFRRLGLAAKLMELLEEISERKGGFFVDLFVRVSNQVAVNMYKQLGYSVYRTVIEYYSASNGEPDEDAYGELPSVAVSAKRSQNTYIHSTHCSHFNKWKRIIVFVGLNILNLSYNI
uniref:N-alpha-acetyltransferase 20 n=1 Tax=Callorhinus ursinus TaxID=34884 RepID=A0A3Q7PRF4_CALUR|nr:N-alpha-acetyltransferase 20 isoform X1 [Callorhinus ursinus]XP_025732671.1 N-alpha-acetyltransferase 20 isoform X1 [Callorhinus ursinus]